MFFLDIFCAFVTDSYSRRSGETEYYFILPQNKYVDLHHFPTQELIYNWNNLPFLIKSVSEPLSFRADLKNYFLTKYETNCDKLNCYSCRLWYLNKLGLFVYRSLHLAAQMRKYNPVFKTPSIKIRTFLVTFLTCLAFIWIHSIPFH